jgi:ABC-2 type transport system permease protein
MFASRALSDAISGALSKLSPLHDVRLPSVGSGSLVVEQYVLINPALNYAGFLLRAVMPTTLHVVIGICNRHRILALQPARLVTLRQRQPADCLRRQTIPIGHSLLRILGIETLILHAGFELPYRGDVLMIVVAAMLFIVAYQSLAALYCC